MRATVLFAIALTTLLATPTSAARLAVTLRDGQAYIAASALERELGMVVKRLPGRGQFVVCGAAQCAPLKEVLAEDGNLLVPVAELGKAMNLTADLDHSRRQVALTPASHGSSTGIGPARVGAIAPNLRLTQLDGRPVSFDELRGQRVLINSWASW